MYKLQNLVEDVSKKAKIKKSVLGEVWDTFNRYVTHNFDQQKGVQVTNFCKIGWAIERRGSNVSYRPYFQLLNSFSEAFQLETRSMAKDLPDKDFCPFEEFNFSKAAIKFSTSLTKDQMFTGLKHLRNQIGEAMSSGATVSIEFELGQLVCRDRRPDFFFVASIYKKRGLTAPHEASDTEYKPSASFQPPPVEELARLRLTGTAQSSAGASVHSSPTRAASQPSRRGTAEVMSVVPEEDPRDTLDEDEIRSAVYSKNMRTPTTAGHSNYSEGSVASGTSEKFQPGPQRRQERAYQEALERHIAEMEGKAVEAIKEREQWETHINRCLQQERDDVSKRRGLCRQNQEFIRQQMEWNEKRRGANRDAFVEAASAHDFPQLSQPPGPEHKVKQTEHKRALKGELDRQVGTNTALKRMQFKKERELEKKQLQANKQEMVTLQAMEMQRKEMTKQALRESWGGATRIKNIERAIENHANAAPHQSHLVLQKSMPELDRASLHSSAGSVASRSTKGAKVGAAHSLALNREKLEGGSRSGSLFHGGKQIALR
mmetsp:Transcript_57872/g.154636  ORF Transcript_57872/g.154636 Transcript_57872/m.154636 type:complete len:545 (+) Transcript_57872:110-1744(+)